MFDGFRGRLHHLPTRPKINLLQLDFSQIRQQLESHQLTTHLPDQAQQRSIV